LCVYDDIIKHIDQGKQVDIQIWDFAKAFDKVLNIRLSKYHSNITGYNTRNNSEIDYQLHKKITP
jgi:hypothetical protein